MGLIEDEVLEVSRLCCNVIPGSKLITCMSSLIQKSSSVSLMARGGPYYFGAKFHVPEEYPVQRIQWEDCDCNLPQALIRFVNGQSKEIARQCVEAPLRKLKTDQEFQPKPSLERTLRFIIEALKGLPTDRCPICEELSLPSTLHPRSDRSAGRRPAVESNELCQQRVTHDKWGLNDVKSAEAKWAHQQARIRELEEVIDFMS
ncbi:hypothetical protein quinque_005938 [Culex quinquefasciatus]